MLNKVAGTNELFSMQHKGEDDVLMLNVHEDNDLLVKQHLIRRNSRNMIIFYKYVYGLSLLVMVVAITSL